MNKHEKKVVKTNEPATKKRNVLGEMFNRRYVIGGILKIAPLFLGFTLLTVMVHFFSHSSIEWLQSIGYCTAEQALTKLHRVDTVCSVFGTAGLVYFFLTLIFAFTLGDAIIPEDEYKARQGE